MKKYNALQLKGIDKNGNDFIFGGDEISTILTSIDNLLSKHNLELYVHETTYSEYYLNISKRRI